MIVTKTQLRRRRDNDEDNYSDDYDGGGNDNYDNNDDEMMTKVTMALLNVMIVMTMKTILVMNMGR